MFIIEFNNMVTVDILQNIYNIGGRSKRVAIPSVYGDMHNGSFADRAFEVHDPYSYSVNFSTEKVFIHDDKGKIILRIPTKMLEGIC